MILLDTRTLFDGTVLERIPVAVMTTWIWPKDYVELDTEPERINWWFGALMEEDYWYFCILGLETSIWIQR